MTTHVYSIRPDVDRYQAFVLDYPDGSPELPFFWNFDGMPKAAEWHPPRIYVDQPRLRVPDVWSLVGAAVLLFRGAEREQLGRYIDVAGELLPVAHEGEKFELLNVLQVVNCLDRDESEIEDEVVDSYAFLVHRLPETGIFKIPETATVELLCVERDQEPGFRALVGLLGLRGLQFVPLWNSTRGTIPLSPPWS